jgi:hypothetical protein
MIQTEDYLALVAAINDGDDKVLPILADYLEEQRNPIHSGLREVIKQKKVPLDQATGKHRSGIEWAGVFSWYRNGFDEEYSMEHSFPRGETFDRLKRNYLKDDHYDWAKDYGSRWEAYEDLARVFTEQLSKGVFTEEKG